MSRWLSLSGVWSDYSLFRKVIVEGIYPMHPLSTFMLTQLSDYLQNRSSMTLISQYILDIADNSIENGIPLVLPEELMSGDLYQEMLSSEINGKQLSQHCIRFDNILRKQGDKLSARSLSVLRANLIARILKFKTRDYEDAKEALMLCSGLSQSEINEELELLENEYALLGFDEHAGCFDFMEDSRGAHEYKIKKRRIAATWQTDFRAMFKTAKVLEIGEVSEPQETSFGINHKILTNEWKYIQEVILAEDVTESLIDEYKNNWKNSISAAVPKGRLVWVYVNKDTNYQYVERLHVLSEKIQGTPILLMLLNDSEGRLASALTNYDILNQMDDNIRQMYSRAYSDDYNQAEDILRNEFEVLKKQRECICPEKVTPLKKRLQVALTEVFEDIYPEVISFNFDGLLTASNNFTGKGSQYYCQIIKMLLSNNVNYDTIHDFTSDVRSKITAVLMENSATSWKCISTNCTIMSPAECRARNVYEKAVHELNTAKQYDCAEFLQNFCYPPYGLSEEAALMMLAVLLANHSYCVRIQYNGTQNSIIRWKDEVIIKDKKINMDLIKMSRLMLIDTNAVEAKFQQFFNRLDVTTDLDAVIHLQKEIQKYADDNGVPEPLEVNYKLANSRFEIANRARKDWDDSILKVEDELEIVMERGNVYNSLSALEALDEIPLYSIFNENGFTMSEDYRARLLELGNEARNIVNTYFDTWLDDTIHCKSVEAMTQFEKHIKRCNEKLIKFGFSSFAQRLSAKGESELAKKDEIRSRQELISDGQKYLAAYKKVSIKNYTDVSDMLSKAKDLLDRLSKFENALGNDAKRLHSQLDQCVGKLDNAKKKMQQDMENIWEDLATAQTLEDIENVQSCIAMVMNYRMTTRDLQDFEELNTALSAFISDVGVLKSAVNDRNLLQQEIVVLRNKYSDAEMDFDVKSVLEAVIKSIENEIDIKDHIWRTKYLTLGNQTREEIHRWKDNTSILPAYLKRDTIDAVEKMRIEADQIVSNAMIEDVVFYFKKLNSEERERCLKLLQNQ